MIALREKVDFAQGPSGRQRIKPAPKAVATGRVPRSSKLMALAIRFEGLIRDGQVLDQSELARVSQLRITQILSLLHLPPPTSRKRCCSCRGSRRGGMR